MPERQTATALLARARYLFDDPENALALTAGEAWRKGFASGGDWMAAALAVVRQQSFHRSSPPLQSLGIAKYALAGAAGFLFVLLGLLIHQPLVCVVGLLAFYVVEAQMVFLFPLALDGRKKVFRESRRWTLRAGGTFAVMCVVVPVAAAMIFGGFVGRGFVRSWCCGCLAICIWYEDLCREAPDKKLTTENATHGMPPVARVRSLNRFQFDASAPLHLRRERIELGLSRPATLLYASDLHLGWRWTNGVIPHLLSAANMCAPDAIILGGDLVDRRHALPLLRDLVAQLAALCPVYALAGNHDHRVGLNDVQDSARTGGATWMDDSPDQKLIPLRHDLFLGATMNLPIATTGHKVFCGHDPAIFPAACDAGYRVVLAGHLHGGQCVLASRRGSLYPGSWFARWTGLRFTRGDTTMIVSRGAADTLPIRWNCPREVIICELI